MRAAASGRGRGGGMSNILTETVTDVRHWTDTLFSLRTTRDPGVRFAAGEFAMVGLDVGGRATDLLRSGRLLAELADRIGDPKELDPAVDRAVICGNPAMTVEMADHLEGLGFEQGANSRPGHFVIEKAFVQR